MRGRREEWEREEGLENEEVEKEGDLERIARPEQSLVGHMPSPEIVSGWPRSGTSY